MGGKKKRIKITSFFKCTKAKLARDLRHYRGRKSIKKIMSSQATQLLPGQVCYVHCNFCNTILAVNIPSNNMLNIVTVRCGHCANLLSVDMGGVVQTDTLQNIQYGVKSQDLHLHSGPISGCSRTVNTVDVGHQRILPNPPPEKRQRVPSAYNKFIKEEIQRIKANNPDISHREAFSAAAKNWAHFPHIHFGLNLDSSSQVNCEEVITAPGGQKSKGLY